MAALLDPEHKGPTPSLMPRSSPHKGGGKGLQQGPAAGQRQRTPLEQECLRGRALERLGDRAGYKRGATENQRTSLGRRFGQVMSCTRRSHATCPRPCTADTGLPICGTETDWARGFGRRELTSKGERLRSG